MKKSLVFTPDEIGQRRFVTLFDGIVIGGSGKAQSKADLQREAELQTALEAISTAVNPDQIDPRLRPANARVLNFEGGTVIFKESELTCIVKLLEAVTWGGAQKPAVADLYSFLDQAPNAVDTPDAQA